MEGKPVHDMDETLMHIAAGASVSRNSVAGVDPKNAVVDHGRKASRKDEGEGLRLNLLSGPKERTQHESQEQNKERQKLESEYTDLKNEVKSRLIELRKLLFEEIPYFKVLHSKANATLKDWGEAKSNVRKKQVINELRELKGSSDLLYNVLFQIDRAKQTIDNFPSGVSNDEKAGVERRLNAIVKNVTTVSETSGLHQVFTWLGPFQRDLDNIYARAL